MNTETASALRKRWALFAEQTLGDNSKENRFAKYKLAYYLYTVVYRLKSHYQALKGLAISISLNYVVLPA